MSFFTNINSLTVLLKPNMSELKNCNFGMLLKTQITLFE